VYSYIRATSRIQVTGFQFEEKPFPTSFTEGTRADGRFVIPMNLNANSTVVSFWYKIPAIYTTDAMGNRVIAFNNTPDTQDNGFLIKIENSSTNNAPLKIYKRTGGTPTLVYTTSNIDLTQWRFFVLIFDSGNFRLYVDDALIASISLQLAADALKYLAIPGLPRHLDTALWSNLLIATYDPAIWTDSYIRFLYETQKPFFV
jgi:hypothetical protein